MYMYLLYTAIAMPNQFSCHLNDHFLCSCHTLRIPLNTDTVTLQFIRWYDDGGTGFFLDLIYWQKKIYQSIVTVFYMAGYCE